MPERRVRLQAAALGYQAAWLIARKLPERTATRLAEWTALKLWKRNEATRNRVARNLAPVVGEGPHLEQVTREAFKSYGRYWLETFRLQDMSSPELDKRFFTVGLENIEKAYAAGKGAVIATMHLGNWDVAGRWVAERWPLVAVVEVLRPKKLFDKFVEHRRKLGMTIVPLVKGGDATAECVRYLNEGRLIALVADRDMSGSGIEVQMFGRRTKIPPGPAVMSLRTGAPLIPAVIYDRPDGTWIAHVTERIDGDENHDDPEAVRALTRKLAQSFEGLARREPSQWHAMFQRYWIDE
ncbi:MAG: phosphatidylinositol mannoside acyltransferase [Actinomycetota bacterium]|nr:phosphatidylinositol mannoside acyltransferase [Actinomycetota bacterium]